VKHPEAQRILHRLISEQADVLVQNLAPGAAARLGLSYKDLTIERADIIVCDISGYGADGPYRDRKAYDLLIQGEAGFLSVTGTDQTPSKAGPSIADIAAGMYAYSNILAALLERQRSGRGRHIDISMLEALGEWMSYPLYYAFEGATPPARTGASHATIYPYGLFRSGDGKAVLLGLQNEREWVSFCEIVLQRPNLAHEEKFAGNTRRNAARQELEAIIDETFATLSADEVIERLERARIANARSNDMHELWAHPQLKARDRWRTVGTPHGEVPALLPPGSWEDSKARMDPVPALGEHTSRILDSLGYSESQAAALRAEGAI
jgi:itaconate CoA-transferase